MNDLFIYLVTKQLHLHSQKWKTFVRQAFMTIKHYLIKISIVNNVIHQFHLDNNSKTNRSHGSHSFCMQDTG